MSPLSPVTIILEWDAGDHVWVSHVAEVGGLSTYGETLEETVAQTREAILGYLETAAEQHMPLPACVAVWRAAI